MEEKSLDAGAKLYDMEAIRKIFESALGRTVSDEEWDGLKETDTAALITSKQNIIYSLMSDLKRIAQRMVVWKQYVYHDSFKEEMETEYSKILGTAGVIVEKLQNDIDLDEDEIEFTCKSLTKEV